MDAHTYAIDMEFQLRKGLDCDRGAFADLINADTIESNCYASIAFTLGYLCATKPEKKKEIEKFINEYEYCLGFGIKGLLLFTSKERVIDGTTHSIEFDTGEDAVNSIIEALSSICE